ncbi:NPCBM/NEW2 domain-containing protein [Streptomyces sp. NPDC002740]
MVETVTAPAPTVTVTGPAGAGTAGTTSPPPTPGSADGESLALQEPVDGEGSLEPGSGVIKGKEYADALTVATCGTFSFTEYSLGTSWKRMTASVGLDDTSSDWPLTVRFLADGKVRASVQAETGDARPVAIEVRGLTRLRIEYQTTGGICDYFNPPLLVIGTPLLTR